jgi:hypothetical protein
MNQTDVNRQEYKELLLTNLSNENSSDVQTACCKHSESRRIHTNESKEDAQIRKIFRKMSYEKDNEGKILAKSFIDGADLTI